MLSFLIKGVSPFKIKKTQGDILILNGDTPLIKKESIGQLFLERKRLASPFFFFLLFFIILPGLDVSCAIRAGWFHKLLKLKMPLPSNSKPMKLMLGCIRQIYLS